jgi:hypothetical protein
MRTLAVFMYIDSKTIYDLGVFRLQLNDTNEVSWLYPPGAQTVGINGDDC